MLRRISLVLLVTSVLAGCGPSVRYVETGGNTDAILQAAANNEQSVTLPVSRIVVLLPGAVTPSNSLPADPPPFPLPTPGHKGGGGFGGAQATATGGSNNSSQTTNDARNTSAAGFSTNFNGDDGKVYTVNVLQTEGHVSFMAGGVNDFWASNDFGITRLANTDIPTIVSNTYTNQIPERVKTIASIVASVATFAPLAPGADATGPSCKGGTLELLAYRSNDTDSKLTDTLCGYSVSLTLPTSPTRMNLVPVNSLPAAANSNWRHVWPVAGCLDATITITLNGKPVVDSRPLRIIDPDYIEVFPLPLKGKISMHPVCSADLADTADDKYQDIFDDMTAVLAALPKKRKA